MKPETFILDLLLMLLENTWWNSFPQFARLSKGHGMNDTHNPTQIHSDLLQLGIQSRTPCSYTSVQLFILNLPGHNGMFTVTVSIKNVKCLLNNIKCRLFPESIIESIVILILIVYNDQNVSTGWYGGDNIS